MSMKAIAVMVVVGLAVVLVITMRTSSRADAAAGDCYAATSGPATPTICN